MAYKHETPNFGIPYPGAGDFYDLNSEKRANEIIDNMLLGAAKQNSGGHGIMREGVYAYVQESNGTFTINLNPDNSKNYPAIDGFINQIYVHSQSTIKWSNLLDNSVYYLYVELIETSNYSSKQRGDVGTSFDEAGNIPASGLLMALVSIISGNVIISPSVPGKILIPRLDDHIANTENPHGSSLSQDSIVVSGIEVVNSGIFAGVLDVTGEFEVSGTSAIHAPLILSSGVTIDEVDVSTLKPLLDGSNVDGLHTHTPSGILPSFEIIAHSPRYGNTVESGIDIFFGTIHTFVPSRLEAVRDSNRNAYRYIPSVDGGSIVLNITDMVPGDFSIWSGVSLDFRTDSGTPDCQINMHVYDKDNIEVGSAIELRDIDWERAHIYISGGQFPRGEPFLTQIEMRGISGIPTYVGDLIFKYIPSDV